MPRKAKEKIEELNTKKTPKKETVVKATSTKSTKKKSTTTKSTTKKKTTSAPYSTKKEKKQSTKKVVKKDSFSTVVEYYDLPFRYNETIVKILAQTPNTLFIYWDISDEDRKQYLEKYGDDFFNTTRPVLVITNKTRNYTFEVKINDFANSWYLHVNDVNCDYKIELGRRPISSSNISENFIPIYTSNQIETPNNHILFDELGKTVFFRNTKTNIIEEKEVSSLSDLRKIGKIYDIYDFYKEIYQKELNDNELGVNLSSSSSSTFK